MWMCVDVVGVWMCMLLLLFPMPFNVTPWLVLWVCFLAHAPPHSDGPPEAIPSDHE